MTGIIRWTRLPATIDKDDIHSDSFYRKARAPFTALIGEKQKSTHSNYYYAYTSHVSYPAVGDVNEGVIDKYVEALKESSLVFMNVRADAVGDIDWTKLQNAVVYIIPRTMIVDGTRYAATKTGVADEMQVHIYPLSLVAAMGTAQFDSDRTSYRDYIWPGLFYNFASFPRRYDYTDKEPTVGFGIRYAKKNTNASLPEWNPRDVKIVYNGEYVDGRKICDGCPSLGRCVMGDCALMAFNCQLPQLKPEFLTAPAPDYSVLPQDKFAAPKDCIAREDFRTYLANHLKSADDEFSTMTQAEISPGGSVGGATRRLRNTICKACILNDNCQGKQGFYSCGSNPRTCHGPITIDDVNHTADKYGENVEPWEYHVTYGLNSTTDGDEIDIEPMKKLFPAFSQYRAGWRTAATGSHCRKDIYRYNQSMAVKNGNDKTRRVILQKHGSTYKNEHATVTYEEWCELKGVKPVTDWSELPWIKNITPEVRLVLNYLITRGAMHAFDHELRIENDRIVYSSSHFTNWCYRSLTEPKQIRNHITLSEVREDENNLLRDVAKNRQRFSRFKGAEAFLNDVRELGEEAAINKCLAKKHTPKPNSPVSLPILSQDTNVQDEK